MSGRHLLFFFSFLFSLSFFLSSLSFLSLPTFTLSLCSFHQRPILLSRHRFI